VGNFPIIVKNLGHEIPSIGKYWEVDVSQVDVSQSHKWDFSGEMVLLS